MCVISHHFKVEYYGRTRLSRRHVWLMQRSFDHTSGDILSVKTLISEAIRD